MSAAGAWSTKQLRGWKTWTRGGAYSPLPARTRSACGRPAGLVAAQRPRDIGKNEGVAQVMDVLAAEYDNMLRCIRCAACLTSCPTYVVTHKEEEGPRGRIAIMRAMV